MHSVRPQGGLGCWNGLSSSLPPLQYLISAECILVWYLLRTYTGIGLLLSSFFPFEPFLLLVVYVQVSPVNHWNQSCIRVWFHRFAVDSAVVLHTSYSGMRHWGVEKWAQAFTRSTHITGPLTRNKPTTLHRHHQRSV